jgi:cell division protein FtsB
MSARLPSSDLVKAGFTIPGECLACGAAISVARAWGVAGMGWLKSLRLSTLMFTLLLAYFVVHVFTGQQGLLSWMDMNHRSAGLEKEAADLEARRQQLEARLARLKPGTVDSDYIEEIAWRDLGFVARDDIVISLNGLNRATEVTASPLPVAVGSGSVRPQ